MDDPFKTGVGTVMLAILNVAGDTSILTNANDSRMRFVRIITEVAAALDERGTLAIPMEAAMSFDFQYIESE